MREKDVEKALVRKVEEAGGTCLKFVSPGNTGVPDRIAILPDGQVWFLEVKTDKGRLSPIQERQIGRMRKAGARVKVIRGADGVEDWLKEVME